MDSFPLPLADLREIGADRYFLEPPSFVGAPWKVIIIKPTGIWQINQPSEAAARESIRFWKSYSRRQAERDKDPNRAVWD